MTQADYEEQFNNPYRAAELGLVEQRLDLFEALQHGLDTSNMQPRGDYL